MLAAPALASNDLDEELVTGLFAPGHRLPVPFQHGGVKGLKILDDGLIFFIRGPHVFPVAYLYQDQRLHPRVLHGNTAKS